MKEIIKYAKLARSTLLEYRLLAHLESHTGKLLSANKESLFLDLKIVILRTTLNSFWFDFAFKRDQCVSMFIECIKALRVVPYFC